MTGLPGRLLQAAPTVPQRVAEVARSLRRPAPVRGPLPAGPRGGQLLIAAHPDDDLLFMSPDLLAGVRDAGAPSTTVYVTSGDAGQGVGYGRSRERGARAAYARMAGVRDRWATSAHAVADAVVEFAFLVDAPHVRLVLLHLPDGGVEGHGSPTTGGGSLLHLRTRVGSGVTTTDGRSQVHTAASLDGVLRALVAWAAPAVVRTLDFVGPLEDPADHSDHRAVARFALEAAAAVDPAIPVLPYIGYPVSALPANVAGEVLAAKRAAFLAYARHDRKMPRVLAEPRPEKAWLERQHLADGFMDPGI